jgi:hypothetical protein
VLLALVCKVIAAHYPLPSRNFRPVAESLKTDAQKLGLQPTVILTMPHTGNGLVYYLNDALAQRKVRSEDDPKGSDEFVAELLSEPIPAGRAQYIVVSVHTRAKYVRAFGTRATIIFDNGHWVVFRRGDGTAPR